MVKQKQITWICPICGYKAKAYRNSIPPICVRCLCFFNIFQRLEPVIK